MAASLAVVPTQKPSSTSATFIAPLRNTLTPLQRKKAIRILSPTLPFGWVTHSGLKPRKYGNHWGLPNYCSKCDKTAKQLGYEGPPNQTRRFMFVHALSEH